MPVSNGSLHIRLSLLWPASPFPFSFFPESRALCCLPRQAHSLTVLGGCVSSLLPMELHGGKKLLIDFPFWGLVSLQWVLGPGQQCRRPQLWDVDSMPHRAVQLPISTSRQLPSQDHQLLALWIRQIKRYALQKLRE